MAAKFGGDFEIMANMAKCASARWPGELIARRRRLKIMSVFQRLSWLLAIGMIVAACGAAPAEDVQPSATTAHAPTTSTEAPFTSTSSTGDVASTGELDVIVVPDENGEYPPDLIVTCPSGPSFPISALDDIADISPDDPDGMLAAIAPFLDNEEGAFWPQEGWQLLHQSPQEAILVAPFEGNLAYMFLDREGDEWAWSGSSANGNPCELQYAVPASLNTVEWRLDPSTPEPGPETTELHVLLTERECVSGQEIGDRLVGPQVVITDTDVRVAFAAAKPPPGDDQTQTWTQTCQGNPEAPYTVELPEPLGDREAIDGMSIGISLEDYVR